MVANQSHSMKMRWIMPWSYYKNCHFLLSIIFFICFFLVLFVKYFQHYSLFKTPQSQINKYCLLRKPWYWIAGQPCISRKKHFLLLLLILLFLFSVSFFTIMILPSILIELHTHTMQILEIVSHKFFMDNI